MIVVQSADEDFPHDVIIYVMVANNRLTYTALTSRDFVPNGNIYELANEHNASKYLPVAVIRNGHIRMEFSFLLDEEVSKEYIVENCIKMVLASIWQAFCDLYKK